MAGIRGALISRGRPDPARRAPPNLGVGHQVTLHWALEPAADPAERLSTPAYAPLVHDAAPTPSAARGSGCGQPRRLVVRRSHRGRHEPQPSREQTSPCSNRVRRADRRAAGRSGGDLRRRAGAAERAGLRSRPGRADGCVRRALLRSRADILRRQADGIGARAPAAACQHCRESEAMRAVVEQLQRVGARPASPGRPWRNAHSCRVRPVRPRPVLPPLSPETCLRSPGRCG